MCSSSRGIPTEVRKIRLRSRPSLTDRERETDLYRQVTIPSVYLSMPLAYPQMTWKTVHWIR